MMLGEGEVMVVQKNWPVWFAIGGKKINVSIGRDFRTNPVFTSQSATVWVRRDSCCVLLPILTNYI
jgi:hypothetical protein